MAIKKNDNVWVREQPYHRFKADVAYGVVAVMSDKRTYILEDAKGMQQVVDVDDIIEDWGADHE